MSNGRKFRRQMSRHLSRERGSMVIDPKRPQINVLAQDGPLVEPVTIPMHKPGGLDMLVVGGISKRLWVATQLLASIPNGVFNSADMQRAVNGADALIAACEGPAPAPVPQEGT